MKPFKLLASSFFAINLVANVNKYAYFVVIMFHWFVIKRVHLQVRHANSNSSSQTYGLFFVYPSRTLLA